MHGPTRRGKPRSGDDDVAKVHEEETLGVQPLRVLGLADDLSLRLGYPAWQLSGGRFRWGSPDKSMTNGLSEFLRYQRMCLPGHPCQATSIRVEHLHDKRTWHLPSETKPCKRCATPRMTNQDSSQNASIAQQARVVIRALRAARRQLLIILCGNALPGACGRSIVSPTSVPQEAVSSPVHHNASRGRASTRATPRSCTCAQKRGGPEGGRAPSDVLLPTPGPSRTIQCRRLRRRPKLQRKTFALGAGSGAGARCRYDRPPGGTARCATTEVPVARWLAGDSKWLEMWPHFL